MISFQGDSSNRFAFNIIAQLPKNFEQGVRRGLQNSGLRLAGVAGRANDGIIKKEMNAPKSGRIYGTMTGRRKRVLQRMRIYQASAPGESPAVITGQLRDSVYFRVEGSNQLRIGADTPYARILELGGVTGRNHASRIARRNYLIRPILESRGLIINDLKNAINVFGK
jgi:phage gpG-like protein